MNKRSGIRNLSLFVLAFVILLNSVSAVPPVQIASNPTNLQIAYPQYPSVQQNRGFTLITSVINETHQKTNLTTTCILHLQNPDGGETCHSKMSYSIADEHFEVDVSEETLVLLDIMLFLLFVIHQHRLVLPMVYLK